MVTKSQKKEEQATLDQSFAYQSLMYKRLFRLSCFCLSLWVLILVEQSWFKPRSKSMEQNFLWPTFDSWQSFTLRRPGDQTVYIFKELNPDSEQRDEIGLSRKTKLKAAWFVRIGDQKSRALDPLLVKRLVKELKTTKVIESRKLSNEAEAKALALSEVALSIEIKQRHGQLFMYRLGTEHLRHSTWVREVDEQGQPASLALRLSGRLRRALDHVSSRWPDRRLGLKNHDELNKIHCFQGHYKSPKHLRQRAWTLSRKKLRAQKLKGQKQTLKPKLNGQSSAEYNLNKAEFDSWFLDLKPRPTLHQATVKSFVYTLQTLRVSQFIQSQDLLKPWRPTHTCIWESDLGQKSWVSFGKAQLKESHSHTKLSDALAVPNNYSGKPWLDVAESESGMGIVPTHLSHFLIKQSARFFSRKLSFAAVSDIVGVSFTPPPSPLLGSMSTWESAWELTKSATGWRLKSNEETQFVSEARQSLFFNQLSRESAQVSYAPQSLIDASLQDLSAKAQLRVTLALSVCQKYKLESCSFELILIMQNLQTKLSSWYRPYDGLLFMVSEDQQKRLTKL